MKNAAVLGLALCVAMAVGYVSVTRGGGRSVPAPQPSHATVATGTTGAELVMRAQLAPRVGQHRKIGAPIELRYQLPSSLRVGETAMAVLELQSQHTAGRMEVRANLPEELSTPGIASQVFYYSAAQPVHRWELPIHAKRAGNLHFGVVAQEYDAAGRAMLARAFAVPVVVGDKAANRAAFKAQQAASPYLRRDPSGRLFVEFPSSPPPPR